MSSLFGRDEQVGIGAAIGAADAAAELVELAEAVAVGAVDEDGVGERDVEAVFDDGGGDEHVVLVVHEGEHDAFQLGFGHLAVAHDDARGGDEFLDARGDFVDGFDAVVDEVDLAAAFELKLDGRADDLLVELGDHGLNRHAVFGRRFDDAHVAQADQRHVQRARDGRGRHGEHVDLLAHLFQALLVAHAEALLFVDDEQAEVLELDVFGEQAVGADEDVDFAGFDFFENDLFCSLAVRKREIISMLMGNCAKRRLKVSKCWKLRTVVGVSTATCLPSCTALKAARMATSVLP